MGSHSLPFAVQGLELPATGLWTMAIEGGEPAEVISSVPAFK